MKRPALLLGLVPLCAVALSVSWWDRATPLVLGLPFNVFWLLAWSFLTPAVMAAAYRLDKRR